MQYYKFYGKIKDERRVHDRYFIEFKEHPTASFSQTKVIQCPFLEMYASSIEDVWNHLNLNKDFEYFSFLPYADIGCDPYEQDRMDKPDITFYGDNGWTVKFSGLKEGSDADERASLGDSVRPGWTHYQLRDLRLGMKAGDQGAWYEMDEGGVITGCRRFKAPVNAEKYPEAMANLSKSSQFVNGEIAIIMEKLCKRSEQMDHKIRGYMRGFYPYNKY